MIPRALCTAGCLMAAATPVSAETPAAMPFSLSHGVMAHALLGQGILEDGRVLAHLSHTCNLTIEGAPYPVLDVVELVKGATTPRGVPRVVILDPGLGLVRAFEYGSARPLFCLGDTLFTHGDVAVEFAGPEGNALTFSEGGETVEVESIEANDLPAPKIEDGSLRGE